MLSGLERQASSCSTYLWERKTDWATGRCKLLREMEAAVGENSLSVPACIYLPACSCLHLPACLFPHVCHLHVQSCMCCVRADGAEAFATAATVAVALVLMMHTCRFLLE